MRCVARPVPSRIPHVFINKGLRETMCCFLCGSIVNVHRYVHLRIWEGCLKGDLSSSDGSGSIDPYEGFFPLEYEGVFPLEAAINPMWTLYGLDLPPARAWFFEVVYQTVEPRVLHLVIRYLGNFNEFESL